MNKEKLKQIRWFSNGVWQFQPHLHFLSNLVSKKIIENDELFSRMETGKVILIDGFYFKLENMNE